MFPVLLSSCPLDYLSICIPATCLHVHLSLCVRVSLTTCLLIHVAIYLSCLLVFRCTVSNFPVDVKMTRHVNDGQVDRLTLTVYLSIVSLLHRLPIILFPTSMSSCPQVHLSTCGGCTCIFICFHTELCVYTCIFAFCSSDATITMFVDVMMIRNRAV